MAVKLFNGTSLVTLRTAKILDNGTLRTLRSLKVMDGGTLRQVASFVPSLTLSGPAGVYGSRSSISKVPITTEPASMTPSGGLGPYTYAWVRLSGVGVVNAASSASTTFTAVVPRDTVEIGIFQVTVTDSTGQTVTANVRATFENTYFYD